MSATTVQFAFGIPEQVTVTAVAAKGMVTGLEAGMRGAKRYHVVWWLDGKRNEEWLWENEIQGAGAAGT